jgi:2,4-dienoyl-CoA reductase-like NADH-dependent reductase (Old Yellow Enzyme family)/thioredoxin reductase
MEAVMAGQDNIKLKKLFEPGKIGKLTLKNRLIKCAAESAMQWDHEKQVIKPGKRGLFFYDAIAAGGVGMVIMESGAAMKRRGGGYFLVPIDTDENIPYFAEYAQSVHKHGIPCIQQFYDFSPLLSAPHTESSSEVYMPGARQDMNSELPHPLTKDEVSAKIRSFIDGSIRSQKAGFDGMEINAGCSHLWATFLSRFWNKRTDEYGPQSLENRSRVVVEMIQGIKKACGQDFVVSVLLNGVETNTFELGNDAECMTVEESAALAKLFEQAGADFIHVRSGMFGSHLAGFFPDLNFITNRSDSGYGIPLDFKRYIPDFISKYDGAGAFIDIAGKIKKGLKIPVGTVGDMDLRLIPGVIGDAFAEGKIDFVLMNRPLMADPELPAKIAAGKVDEVRPCTKCITCFNDNVCRVNAAMTRAGGETMPEGYHVLPAAKKKRVLVIGGGPAGMEAARVAAMRGHQVSLYEKSSKLGGLMLSAAVVKGPHERILDFVGYLSNQLSQLGVEVKLGQAAGKATVQRNKPDVVIVAVGGAYSKPGIPGINNPIVVDNESMHSKLELGIRFINPLNLRDLTKFYLPLGQRVVVIGGEIHGIEMAEFLVERGRLVTLVDELPLSHLGKGIPPHIITRHITYVQTHGVRVMMGVKFEEITSKGLTVTKDYGFKETIEADTIALAVPLVPNKALFDSLQGIVPEVYAIGDCNEPGLIVSAVAGSNLVARKI